MKVFRKYLFLLTFIFDFSISHISYIVVGEPSTQFYQHNNPFLAALFDKYKPQSHSKADAHSYKPLDLDINTYYHYHDTQPYNVYLINRTNDLRTRPCKTKQSCKKTAKPCKTKKPCQQTKLKFRNKPKPRVKTAFEDYPDYIAEKLAQKSSAQKVILSNGTVVTTEDPDPYYPDWDPSSQYETDNSEYEPYRMLRTILEALKQSDNRKFSDEYFDLAELFRAKEDIKSNSVDVVKVKTDLTEQEETIMQKAATVVAKYLYKIMKKNRLNQNARKTALAKDTIFWLKRALESTSQESGEKAIEVRSKKKKRVGKAKKPKRFQVIDDNDSLNDDYTPEESNESEIESREYEQLSEEVTTRKPVKSKPRKPGRPETVMQAASRLYKEGRDFRKYKDYRRREPIFMPKRYHWESDDYQKLGYFWFNGPQGRNPGPWRVVY